jgi:hypothetical protein
MIIWKPQIWYILLAAPLVKFLFSFERITKVVWRKMGGGVQTLHPPTPRGYAFVN